MTKYSKPIIALTGGLACGKSLVTKMFREIGRCDVVSADAIAHQVVEPGQPAYFDIVKEFGDKILTKDKFSDNDGKLLPIDRKKLRNLVFQDSKKSRENLRKLEAITHPRIEEATKEAFDNSNAEYVIWEVPLLYETGLYRVATEVIAIVCNRMTQILRASSRDKTLSLKTISEILDHQATNNDRISIANYVLVNDENTTVEDLKKKVKILDRKIMEGIERRHRMIFQEQLTKQHFNSDHSVPFYSRLEFPSLDGKGSTIASSPLSTLATAPEGEYSSTSSKPKNRRGRPKKTSS